MLLMWLARFGLKAAIAGFPGFSLAMMWAMGLGVAVLLWWLLLSRAPWLDRLGGIALMIAGLACAWFFKHESMGPLWLAAYAFPTACSALVVGAAAASGIAGLRRRLTMAAIVLVACAGWMLLRTDGISGDHVAEFGWRWAKSPEELLLTASAPEPVASKAAEPVAPKTVEIPAAIAESHPLLSWPGFRGKDRDGVVRGVRIDANSSAKPPVQVWRKPVGPGWSSFAVAGDLIYTQEQRGEFEVVSCYRLSDGVPVWVHRDAARFFESNAGAGPRATPSIANGRVYSFGATGILNALDERTGALVWSHLVTDDTEAMASQTGGTSKVPDWGFASSPLVFGDMVIVAAAGQLAAYDAATGKLRWLGAAGGAGYSSPHLADVGGSAQVLLASSRAVTAVSPGDGKPLWSHSWKGFPMVQPAVMADGEILLAAGGDAGVQRIGVTQAGGAWAVTERWSSNGLKPYFNDFVVHEGHAYGFDGRILSCIDLKDGTRRWKGGRYGNGQMILLAEQSLLLVLSEEGELALVRAVPDQFTEVARFKAIEGKTWNHPVLVGDLLLVRNAEEMAAFRLSVITAGK